jgi:protein-tyrosine phosphatase
MAMKCILLSLPEEMVKVIEKERKGMGVIVVSNTHLYYQQSGDARNPYFAQYSPVCEDAPVRVS